MRRIMAHITARSEQLAEEPIFQYLRDESVDPEQRISFMPMMAHFVFSFMDVNMYIIRNERIDTPYQRLINIHSYEDATHWPWWINDMKRAGLDKTCTFTDALLFVWSDATRRSRMLTYDFVAIAAKASPKQLLAIVETVESTGYKFLSTSAEVCKTIPNNPYLYFGSTHSNVESGHHMGTDDAIDYLEAIELSDEEFSETKLLVDRLYVAYTDFLAEMYDWVQSHDLREMRQSPFYSERVSGPVSRPLNAEELLLHRTPVATSSAAGVIPNRA